MTTLACQIDLPKNFYSIEDLHKRNPLEMVDRFLVKMIFILMILNGLLLIINLPKIIFHLALTLDWCHIQWSYYWIEWAGDFLLTYLINGKVLI